jgi:hypothetical protein
MAGSGYPDLNLYRWFGDEIDISNWFDDDYIQSPPQTFQLVSIESAEAFGELIRFVPQITIQGVTGGYIFPQPRQIIEQPAAQRFTLLSISSEESFGLPDLHLSYRAVGVGIPSEEAFGDLSVIMLLTIRGIWTQERVNRIAAEQDWTEQNNLALLLAA